MPSFKREKGFAILTTTLLLSIASIAFSVNMASTQLIDNQIVANNYRNQQAFVNAESGINLILSKLDKVDIAKDFLSDLSAGNYSYNSISNHYIVTVSRVHTNRMLIESIGKSSDGTAKRSIQVQVDYAINFNVPDAPLSLNGALNLDHSASLNDGCEGVAAEDCVSAGNIADNLLVSNPSAMEYDPSAPVVDQASQGYLDAVCMGAEVNSNGSLNLNAEGVPINAEGIAINATVAEGGSYQTNIIDPNVILSGVDGNRIVDNGGSWEDSSNTDDGDFFDSLGLTATSSEPRSLFEKTFGVEHTLATMGLIEVSASFPETATTFFVDMNDGMSGSCSSRLEGVADQHSLIYIQGDCDVSQTDAAGTHYSENKRFTIGSVENPKIVLIEGGTFITAPNTGASIVGIAYFLPVLDSNDNPLSKSVVMGGLRVNGALLSEYRCSSNSYHKADSKGTKEHFSSRFDRTILNELYDGIGMGANDSLYRVIEGTWRDF